MSVLSQPQFHSEPEAFKYLESVVWADGIVCAHCFNDRTIHSNTVEGYFSIFKRGMKGVYQHCGEQHLHRYLAEFDFRYSNREANGVNDRERSIIALKGVTGRRLLYRDSLAA